MSSAKTCWAAWNSGTGAPGQWLALVLTAVAVGTAPIPALAAGAQEYSGALPGIDVQYHDDSGVGQAGLPGYRQWASPNQAGRCLAQSDDFGLVIEYSVTNSPVSGGQIDFTATLAPSGEFDQVTVTFVTDGNVVLNPPIDPVVLTDLQPGVDVALTGTLDITTTGTGQLTAFVLGDRQTSCGDKTLPDESFDFYVLDDGTSVYTGKGDLVNLEAARIEDLYSSGSITQDEAQVMANTNVLASADVPGDESSGEMTVVPGGRANVTISGHAQWTDIQGNLHRCRNVEVEVFNPWLSVFVPVGSTTADSNGEFTLSFDPGFGLLDPHTLIVRVYARNYAADVYSPLLVFIEWDTYFRQRNFYNVPDGASYTNEVFTADACTAAGQAFSIADAIIEGHEYYTAMSGASPPQIKVNWPEPLLGSSFDILLNDSIQIGPDLAFAWDVILHEYGHYLAFLQELNCYDCLYYDPIHGCPHAGWDDQTLVHGKEQGIKLAWQEGLATYIGTATQIVAQTSQRNVPYAGDVVYEHVVSQSQSQGCTSGQNVFDHIGLEEDAETDSPAAWPPIPAGEGVETNVTRVLWDLADPADGSEPEDVVDLGQQGLWNVLTSAAPQSGCIGGPSDARHFTLSDFWNHLASGKPNSEQLQYGAVFELNKVAPRHSKPANGAKLPDANHPPRFSWLGTTRLNEFTVKVYDQGFNLILESNPPIVAAVDPANPDLYVDSNGWTPNAAEWATILDAATSGVGTNGLIYWAIEGRNSEAPATGPYLSGAWKLGTPNSGDVDIALIIDISGSMTDEMQDVKDALLDAINTNSIPQGPCQDLSHPSNPGCPTQLCPTCPAPGITAATYFQLTTFKDGGDVTVPGVANIFGAGHAVPPSPGGAGGGELPPEFNLPPGTGRVVTFPSVTGWASCGCPEPNPPVPPSNSSGPDGGDCASGTTDILSWDGISGIIHGGATMFLCGVFLGPDEPLDPAPPRLDFTDNTDFLWLAPEIGQTFFIGDGLTGTGTGSVQEFLVPDGATRLFLGFADALEFGNPTSLPGYYFDNCGELFTEFPTVVPNNATCCKDTIIDEITGLSAADESGCGEPSVQALIAGTSNLKKGGTVFLATDEPPSAGSDLNAAIAALRLRGARVNVLLSGDCDVGTNGGAVRQGGYDTGLEAFSQMAAETDGSMTYVAGPGPQYRNTAANIARTVVQPSIISALPAAIQRASTARLTLVGQNTNFNSGTSVTFSSDGLLVSSVEVVSPIELNVLVIARPDAALVFVDVDVTTPLAAGVHEHATGNGVVQVVAASGAARLTSVTPSVVLSGRTGDVEIRGVGTHFDGGSVVDFGAGITVDSIDVVCANRLTAQITVDAGVNTTFRNVSVTTGDEVASNVPGALFRVQPAPAESPPTLSIDPDMAYAGQSLVARVTLDGFVIPDNPTGQFEVIFTPPDVAVSHVEVCSTDTFDVTLVTVSDASPGFHDVTLVTTNGSATALAAFNILVAYADCNGNGYPDDADILAGTSSDCNGDAIPDECQSDCDGNGVPDECDIAAGMSADCNCNELPDECEILDAFDCNENGTPDDCDIAAGQSTDCDGNGIPDTCDLQNGIGTDCNSNGLPDWCDIAFGTALDCNSNGLPDQCDLAEATSTDCNTNGVPDECDMPGDCNGNGTNDLCDVLGGTSLDCNGNGSPDECDIAAGALDCDGNGVPDVCELPGGTTTDCNGNTLADHCEILAGSAEDCNTNQLPDSCDISGGTSTDCNNNGVPDDCDLAGHWSSTPPADMAELNAASWVAWAQSGEATLSDDPGFKQVGQGSVRMDVTGGLDNYARYPASQEARWDVTGVEFIRVWFYAINPNPGFQEQSPWVRLGDDNGYYQWRPTWDILNNARNQWVEFFIPIAGDATWQRTIAGEPSFTEIHYIEIHADTWGAGFTLWIDGLHFDPNPSGVSDCNSNGYLDSCDVLGGTSVDCDTNGVPDECEPDCNVNGVADACDIAGGTSADCDGDGVPDDCQPDCNGNGVFDLCDIAAATSEDCNSNSVPDSCDVAVGTSPDCNSNGVPDECDGVVAILYVDFQGGLPTGWTADGLWHTTDQCQPEGLCDPAPWAYYGLDATCDFNTGEASTSGTLASAPVTLPAGSAITLTYCSIYSGEAGDSLVDGYDWAWLSVNDAEVDDVSFSGSTWEWEVRTVDLSNYAGQTVTLEWNFDSIDGISNDDLGWQIDRVELAGRSADCNNNGVLDECDIASGTSLDGNTNGIPDECEVTGDCNGDGDVDLVDYVVFESCMTGPLDGPVPPQCSCVDLDANLHVDLRDFAVFQRRFTE